MSNEYKEMRTDKVQNATPMNTDTFVGLQASFNKLPGITTDHSMEECKVAVGGSQKYGLGGKWAKDGMRYLTLNGRLSRSGMPKKLSCSDGDIPVSQTDLNKLSSLGLVAGKAPVEFI